VQHINGTFSDADHSGDARHDPKSGGTVVTLGELIGLFCLVRKLTLPHSTACSLYYKHVMIVIYARKVTLKFAAYLIVTINASGFLALAGSAKANGREPKCCLG